ncbi:MAG: hypothetical protein NTZ74_03185 [Chloroflexi bacterium]|nr:hypothetical protein [Chloroflexota bacterium]
MCKIKKISILTILVVCITIVACGTKQVATIQPALEPTNTLAIIVAPTNTNTPLSPTATQIPTNTIEPTATQTPTQIYYTYTPTPYPSPTGTYCEIEQQWGRGEGHDFQYGCFAMSCSFADGTGYGNNLACIDRTIGTPWPFKWNFYHPLMDQLTK